MSSSKLVQACFTIFYWFSQRLSLTCLISRSTFSVRSNFKNPMPIDSHNTFLSRVINSIPQIFRPFVNLTHIMTLMRPKHKTRRTYHTVIRIGTFCTSSIDCNSIRRHGYAHGRYRYLRVIRLRGLNPSVVLRSYYLLLLR